MYIDEHPRILTRVIGGQGSRQNQRQAKGKNSCKREHRCQIKSRLMIKVYTFVEISDSKSPRPRTPEYQLVEEMTKQDMLGNGMQFKYKEMLFIPVFQARLDAMNNLHSKIRQDSNLIL